MYENLYRIALVGFFLVPPIVIWTRYYHPTSMPWWLSITLIVFGCWVLAHLSVTFQFRHLDALVIDNPDVSQELLERWSNDGGKKVFAALFGWLYGIIYSIPYLMIYGVARWWRHRSESSDELAA